MGTHTRIALITLIALAPTTVAWRAIREPLLLDPQSRLWIDGTLTMKSFSCKAPGFSVEIDATHGAAAAVLTGSKAVRTVLLHVPAAQMECGNGTMNEHMMTALKAKDAPIIEFRLTDYELAPSDSGASGTVNGMLTIGGKEHTVVVPIRAMDASDGLLRVTGAYPLHMKEFGLKPPTFMFGSMKVGELVTVRFDLLLRSGSVAAAARGR